MAKTVKAMAEQYASEDNFPVAVIEIISRQAVPLNSEGMTIGQMIDEHLSMNLQNGSISSIAIAFPVEDKK